MKGLLFFGFLLIVLLVASLGLVKEQHLPTKEGFVNPGSDASLLAPQVVIPETNPKPSPLEGTSPAPYLPPVEKEYGPAFGEIARVNTLPYKDPTLEAAPYARLAELLQSLEAFMTFEAKSLQSMSDPEIQLPLTTARGDLNRVKDEVDVLKRNPGIGSALTQGQVDDIQANLQYLQRKYRLSVNAVSGNSLLEGFVSTPTSTSTYSGSTSPRITLKQLGELIVRVTAEIVRLSASGTTDPVITGRINTLQQIKNNLKTIETEVKNKTRPESEIPILKSDMDKFLPLMSDPSKPLPQLLKSMNLPMTASNAFPAYAGGDTSGAKIAQTLFKNYGDAMFKGLSWGVGLKYTSQNELDTTRAEALKAIAPVSPAYPRLGGSQPGASPAELLASSRRTGKQGENVFVSFPRGEFEAVTAGNDEVRLVNGRPTNPIGETAKFDWKVKSSQICDAIRKRGLNPADFGCTPANRQVSPDYSWRGNARMVCTRLLTAGPGEPEACGCPPLNWPGWRS